MIPCCLVPARRFSSDWRICAGCDPIWLAKAHRGEYFVDLTTGMSNAVLVVDATWIEHVNPAVVLEIHTRILGPEELLASKLFVTRRERFDGADIAHIIYVMKGKIAWDRICTWWEIIGKFYSGR